MVAWGAGQRKVCLKSGKSLWQLSIQKYFKHKNSGQSTACKLSSFIKVRVSWELGTIKVSLWEKEMTKKWRSQREMLWKANHFKEVKDRKVLLGHVSQCPSECMRKRQQQKSSGLEHHTLAKVKQQQIKEKMGTHLQGGSLPWPQGNWQYRACLILTPVYYVSLVKREASWIDSHKYLP